MNNSKVAAIFGLTILVAAGSIFASGNVSSMLSPAKQESTVTGLPMMGHIELVAKDSDGNIKAYRQTDNQVMIKGKTCVGTMVFGANTTTQCSNGNLGKFRYIALGTNTTLTTGTTNEDLGQIGNRGLDAQVGLDNATATVGAKSTIDRQFLLNGTTTVNQVGLYNDATAGYSFARQIITAINVNSGDTVTVKWTITIG